MLRFGTMARGWESKSVESQLDDARAESDASRVRLSKEELERRSERESLELSRRRIVTELASTQSPVYRATLEAALAHLDSKLAKLA